MRLDPDVFDLAAYVLEQGMEEMVSYAICRATPKMDMVDKQPYFDAVRSVYGVPGKYFEGIDHKILSLCMIAVLCRRKERV